MKKGNLFLLHLFIKSIILSWAASHSIKASGTRPWALGWEHCLLFWTPMTFRLRNPSHRWCWSIGRVPCQRTAPLRTTPRPSRSPGFHTSRSNASASPTRIDATAREDPSARCYTRRNWPAAAELIALWWPTILSWCWDSQKEADPSSFDLSLND